MTRDLSKAQRRRIRELAAIAYELDLSAELTALESEFARWRRGELGARDLSERIHAFHQGPARKLWSLYETGDQDVAVAAAVHRGVLRIEDTDEQVLLALEPHLRFLRAQEEHED